VDSHLYVYLEYVSGGSLRSMLNEFGAPSLAVIRKATRGLAKGLHYLHSQEPPVVHRDLKGANVLVEGNFHLKLADFGCSKQSEATQSFSTVGSIHWVAPEVLRDEGHGRRADIWSFGCVLIEIATAADPWGAKAFDNRFAAMRYIGFTDNTPPVPEGLCTQGRDLVVRCTQRNHASRPATLGLLRHPFLAHASSMGSRSHSDAFTPME
jgi:serine/threonine protein kinase